MVFSREVVLHDVGLAIIDWQNIFEQYFASPSDDSDVHSLAQSWKPGQAGPWVLAQQGLWPSSEQSKAKAAGSGRGF
jgi:hypothetical protein